MKKKKTECKLMNLKMKLYLSATNDTKATEQYLAFL